MSKRRKPAVQAAATVSTTQLGVPGLEQTHGYITEELHPRLRGRQAMRIFEEMKENDATLGAGLYSIEGFLRRIRWTLKPADESEAAKAEADFVESCMYDTERPWSDFISDILTMLPYGFGLSEIIYKYRRGPYSSSPRFRSKYDDGRVGWRLLDLRAQTTIGRWDLDSKTGEIYGAWQETDQGEVYLPMDRCLLFRTKTYKNNPEGRSVLRSAYRSWHFKKRLEETEAVGAVRSLVNIPKMELPLRVMSPNASNDERSVRAQYEKMMSLLARDQLTAIVVPTEMDEQGHSTGYKFSLVGATGTQLPLDPIIRRYDVRMMMSLAAEFLMLGTEKTGSFALAAEKATNFVRSLEWYADVICDQLNIAIQRLMMVNNVPPELWPCLKPEPIADVDVKDLALFISQVSAGKFLTPTHETENALRKRTNLPLISEEEWDEAVEKADKLAEEKAKPPEPPEPAAPDESAQPDTIEE